MPKKTHRKMPKNPYRRARCVCGVGHTKDLTPAPTADEFQCLVKAFYSAVGIQGLMRSLWPEQALEGDGELASWYSASSAVARRTAETLSDLFLKYLIRATWRELRHSNAESRPQLYFEEDSLKDWWCKLLGIRESASIERDSDKKGALRKLAKWLDIPRYAFNENENEATATAQMEPPQPGWIPCYKCQPERAMLLMRAAYACFGTIDWYSNFGGDSWLEATEAVIGRLSVLLGDAVYLPGFGVFEQDANSKCLASKIGPPIVCDYAGVYLMYGDPVVFVDAILDMEHNTGCILNKGYIKYHSGLLKMLQDDKRLRCPTEWAVGWDYVVERVRKRRAELAWNTRCEAANSLNWWTWPPYLKEFMPCPHSDTGIVKVDMDTLHHAAGEQGKHLGRLYGASAASTASLLEFKGVDICVLLDRYRRPHQITNASVYGGRILRWPVSDMECWSPDELWRRATTVAKYLLSGCNVCVSCIAGHGRTGTLLAATVLVLNRRLGQTPPENIVNWIRKHYCNESIESAQQIDTLMAIEKWLSRGGISGGLNKAEHLHWTHSGLGAP